MDNDKRISNHKKIEGLENIFPEMESLLGPAELEAIEGIDNSDLPVLLMVGCPRSGTTLLYQYLAATGILGYPSNLISRFYYSPYIGIRIQQIMTDLDARGEIMGTDKTINFNSQLGKTRGALQPHEFWYFWNRFFKFGTIQRLRDEELQNVDTRLLIKELEGMQVAFGKPLILKALNLNWHIHFLAKLSNKFKFIFMRRELSDNAYSLYNARKEYFGNDQEWYSFKPPEFRKIEVLHPTEQVVEQVLVNNFAIENQLKTLNENNYYIVNYDEFLEHPLTIVKEILTRFDIEFQANCFNGLPQKFNKNSSSPSDSIFSRILNYIRQKSDMYE